MQAAFHPRSEHHIEDFVAQATFEGKLGAAVEHLDLNFAYKASSSVVLLRSLFQLVPNLTQLILSLSHDMPARLFEGVHFPQLEYMCTNQSHSAILPFLRHHSWLHTLEIGACDSTTLPCPLSPLVLTLDSLECPLECAKSLKMPGIIRLAIDVRSPETDVPSTLRAFPMNHARDLTLQYHAYDQGLLAAVCATFPHVTELKLFEKPGKAEVSNGVSTPCFSN